MVLERIVEGLWGEYNKNLNYFGHNLNLSIIKINSLNYGNYTKSRSPQGC